MYLHSEGPVVCGSCARPLCPLSEEGRRCEGALDLCEESLHDLRSDGVSSSLELGQPLIVLHHSAVPLQTVGIAVLQDGGGEGTRGGGGRGVMECGRRGGRS